MYKEYAVPMKGPENVEQLEHAVQNIVQESKLSVSKLINMIETDVNAQETFLKKQHDLLKAGLKSFKEVLSRINVLTNVAKILKVDPEAALMDTEKSGLKEPLLEPQALATELAMIGGTIQVSEENTLKRLLFRSTRGKAVLNTFDLVIEEQDVLLDEDKANRKLGYFVIF